MCSLGGRGFAALKKVITALRLILRASWSPLNVNKYSSNITYLSHSLIKFHFLPSLSLAEFSIKVIHIFVFPKTIHYNSDYITYKVISS